MQSMRIAEGGNVGVVLNGEIHLLEDFVRLLLGQLAHLFVLVLPLLAHEDLLELLGQDVDVAGEQGEEVGVVEVDVEVELLLLVSAGQVHVHRVGDVLSQHGDGLGYVINSLLFSFGDSLSLWMDLNVFTKRSNFHSSSEFICVRILKQSYEKYFLGMS
jgi:hypothetical protein